MVVPGNCGNVLLCTNLHYIVADVYEVYNILRFCVCVGGKQISCRYIAMLPRNAFVIFGLVC